MPSQSESSLGGIVSIPIAYGAQQEKTALVVGASTYGAANNNKKFPIAPEFVLSVSYNRPINPISRTNWKGTGVKPDIPVARAILGLPALPAPAPPPEPKLADQPVSAAERKLLAGTFVLKLAQVSANLHDTFAQYRRTYRVFDENGLARLSAGWRSRRRLGPGNVSHATAAVIQSNAISRISIATSTGSVTGW
jgi:hypothetical protein